MRNVLPGVAEAELAPGSELGAYLVDSVVGIGGMGTVYEAHHRVLGRRVAIKVLHRSVNTQETVDRLIDEGRAASNLGHPHIVECTDIGHTDDGRPYLVMEFLDGKTLAVEIAEHGMLPAARACNIALQIASALEVTHAAGIIHRDLKSDNVFLLPRVDGGDQVKVIDFGISKFEVARHATRPGTILGTADFMSPEQVRDPGSVDARTDIYAIGVLLYHMLTGRLPFQDVEFPLVLSKIVDETPPPIADFRPTLPGNVIAVVEKAMARDRAERFASASELIKVLRQALPEQTWLTPTPLVLRAPSSVGRTQPMRIARMPSTPAFGNQPRRSRMPVMVAAIGAFALASVGVGWYVLSNRQEASPVAPGPAPAPALAHLDVQSNADGAVVVFRGESHPLPLRLDVDRGTAARELFEIRADGYQTRQFWLSVDGSVKLQGELERVADAPVAVASTMAADAGADARSPEPKPPSTVRPNKPNVRPPPIQPAISKSDPPTPKPDPATVLTKPEPIPTKPEPIPTKPEPKPTKPELIVTPPATIKPGTVDAAAVRAVVGQHVGQIRACYDRGKMEDAMLAGRVTVIVKLSPSGAVTSAQVAATDLHSPTVESCVIKSVREWQFPAPTGGVAATISYPFVFK